MKKRKLIQKEKRAKQKARIRFLWKATLFSVCLAVLGGICMYIYQYHASIVSIEGVKLWVSEHKKNLHQEFKKVKVASTRVSPPEIHYEFYTALPNMHMIVPTPASLPAALSDPKNKLASKAPIVSPEEIEEALSQQIKTKGKKNDL